MAGQLHTQYKFACLLKVTTKSSIHQRNVKRNTENKNRAFIRPKKKATVNNHLLIGLKLRKYFSKEVPFLLYIWQAFQGQRKYYERFICHFGIQTHITNQNYLFTYLVFRHYRIMKHIKWLLKR